MLRHMDDKSNQIQLDLIDGLDLFEKHYTKSNATQSKQAQSIWENMYTERTNMLWSKEEYLNSMSTYHQISERLIELEMSMDQMDDRRRYSVMELQDFEDRNMEA